MTELTPERLAELRRIAEAATPGLRLTPEKREQLRRLTEAVEHGTAPVITHEADLAARAFREIERLQAKVERVVQDLYERTRTTARDWRQSGHPYHDGASDAYCEAFLMVRRVLGEAGGGD